MATNKCLTVFLIIYVIALITGIVLMAKSFAIIDLNYAALKQNTFSRNIEPGTVYLPGRYSNLKSLNSRYFTGITGQFITYPTTWYSIDYASGGTFLSNKI